MKKSTTIYLLMITALAFAFSTEGCKKSSPTSTGKGCNDSNAVNYSASSTGTTCIYPSDKLAGSWNVTEIESQTNNTINYTASITKVDNLHINIKNNSDYPSTVPVFHKNDLTMQVQWSNKTFVPNGNITGTIVDVNTKWTISYTLDTLGNTYKIKQTYTK